jgi:hypothetical protein
MRNERVVGRSLAYLKSQTALFEVLRCAKWGSRSNERSIWLYRTVAVTGPHLEAVRAPGIPFLPLALAIGQEHGLFMKAFCLYKPEILPVLVEVGNTARSYRRHQRFTTARKSMVSQCDTANEVLSQRQFCRAIMASWRLWGGKNGVSCATVRLAPVSSSPSRAPVPRGPGLSATARGATDSCVSKRPVAEVPGYKMARGRNGQWRQAPGPTGGSTFWPWPHAARHPHHGVHTIFVGMLCRT